jgi:DNA anti-recombination protein RmuC
MTIEERFERIEHVTAGLAEERKKDREENRQIWRDTQRQINELSVRIIEMGEELGQRIEQVSERLGLRIEQLAEQSRAEDKRLGERIDKLGERVDSLVSAIGALVAGMSKPKSGD